MNRLRIPTLLIDKQLVDADSSNAQAIVDAPDSAAWLQWRNYPVIADHATQSGTWRLQFAVPYLTWATVERNGKTMRYVCEKKQRGEIKDGKMYDAQGQSAHDQHTDLCIYTCTGRKPNGNTEVWLTYWRKV